jgi:phenylpropionate dioxygenase-like ring-hydroxylating dioxygenase large terminal subunit
MDKMVEGKVGSTAKRKPRSETRGERVAPQGEGGFDINWYPVCLSDDIRAGEVKGLDFLDGRVVVFRGENGIVKVMSAYCRHFGADLGGGKVIGNEVQCPYHHWQYGQDGYCKHIPIGGAIPKNARQFVFPTIEKWGLVFAFNGLEPTYELPEFPIPADKLAYRTFGVLKFKLDMGLQITNSVDFQHLIVLHGLEIDKYPEVEFHKNGMRQTGGLVWRDNLRAGGAKSVIDSQITGTNFLMFGGDMAGNTAYAVITGTPITAEGCTYGYTIMAMPRAGEGPEAEQAVNIGLGALERWSHALMIEDDQPIMDNISFRMDNLLRHDRYVAEMFRYLQKYPRAHPSEEFIKK